MSTTTSSAARVTLYQALAEALARPESWLARAGEDWPLCDAALQVAHDEGDDALRQIAADLVAIPPENLDHRQRRYDSLLASSGASAMMAYESLAREGRLAGPYMFAVWSAYRAAGLDVADSELPDHVSVELAFLAYLAQQEVTLPPPEARQWRRAKRMFVKRHAGAWIPLLGDALAGSGDAVYAPIGRLLAATLRSEIRPRKRRKIDSARRLPVLAGIDACNLCGFCVQVCPTQALRVHETDDTTALLLDDSRCVACGRCVDVCSTGTLHLETNVLESGSKRLFQSPRAHCPGCGQPTISQAELDTVAGSIGRPAWLDYCFDCRSSLVEGMR